MVCRERIKTVEELEAVTIAVASGKEVFKHLHYDKAVKDIRSTIIQNMVKSVCFKMMLEILCSRIYANRDFFPLQKTAIDTTPIIDNDAVLLPTDHHMVLSEPIKLRTIE